MILEAIAHELADELQLQLQLTYKVRGECARLSAPGQPRPWPEQRVGLLLANSVVECWSIGIVHEQLSFDECGTQIIALVTLLRDGFTVNMPSTRRHYSYESPTSVQDVVDYVLYVYARAYWKTALK